MKDAIVTRFEYIHIIHIITWTVGSPKGNIGMKDKKTKKRITGSNETLS